MNDQTSNLKLQTSPWAHPTGQSPKRVQLVALGPTKADLIAAQTAHMPEPPVIGFDEVWSLNAAVHWMDGRVRFDTLFVLDYLDGERAKYPGYVEAIEHWAARHQAPVITSIAGASAEKPHIYEYPLGEVIAAAGKTAHLYLHNSIPMIIAYALMLGVEELQIWGADYSHEATKRREEDRACAEYWIGYAAAKGMRIQAAPQSTLLNSNQPPRVYGYPFMPVKVAS